MESLGASVHGLVATCMKAMRLLLVFLYALVYPMNAGAQHGTNDAIRDISRQVQLESSSSQSKRLASTSSTARLELVSQLGGAVFDSAVNGNYSYAAVGSRLAVLDVSSPATPSVVGMSQSFSESVRAVASQGSFAYLLAGSNAFIVDTGTPSNPTIVGRVSIPGQAYDVVVNGNYAYITAFQYLAPTATSTLLIVDISNKQAPQTVGRSTSYGNYSFGRLVVSGIYAYVSAGQGGLRVLNVADPGAPHEIGSFLSSGFDAVDIVVSGNYAYLADWSKGLRVIDVSNPAAPIQIALVTFPPFPHGIAISGNIVALADGPSGLQLIDVSTPSAPIVKGRVVLSDDAWQVTAHNGRAYISTTSGGLQVVDFRNASTPVLLSQVDFGGAALGVLVDSSKAYVSSGYSGVRTIDVTNPQTPVQLRRTELSSDEFDYANALTVNGDYVYVASPGRGMPILSLATMTELGRFRNTGTFYDSVALQGSYAYLASWNDGLRIVNVSQAANPYQTGSIDTMGVAYGIAVSGSIAYVADGTGGLRTIDVSNPAAPAELGSILLAGSAWKVAIHGTTAYVASLTDGLNIVDVTNPRQPTLISQVASQGSTQSATIANGYVYVADGRGGVAVYDASNAASPSLIARFDTNGFARQIAIVGEYVYVADYDEGLVTLRLLDNGPSPDTYLLSVDSLPSAVVGGIAASPAPQPSNGRYDAGTVVTLDATPSAGYAFSHWIGDIDLPSDSHTTNVVMNRDRNVRAVFAPVEAIIKPVIVFVHGWHGLPFHSPDYCTPGYAQAEEYTGQKLGEELSDFQKWPSMLVNATDAKIYVARVHSGYLMTPIIANNTDCLAGQIDRIRQETGARKVILIGHSMGGLIVRLYASRYAYRGDVSDVITLGTPHDGTPLGDGMCAAFAPTVALSTRVSTAECQFATGDIWRGQFWTIPVWLASNFGLQPIDLFNEQEKGNGNVRYWLIGGTYAQPVVQLYNQWVTAIQNSTNPLTWLQRVRLMEVGAFFLPALTAPHDAVIERQSSIGVRTDGTYVMPQAKFVRRYSVANSHSASSWTGFPGYFAAGPNLLDTPTEAYQCVQSILSQVIIPNNPNATPSGCTQPYISAQSPESRAAAETSASVVLPTVQLPAREVTLTQFSPVMLSVPLDVAGSTSLYVGWLTGTVGLSLTSPSGQVMDAAFSAANPTVAQFTLSQPTSTSVGLATYQLTGTQPGTYTLTVTPLVVPPGGTPLAVFGAFQSPRVLDAVLDRPNYVLGQTATITAVLADISAVPYSAIDGAAVTATLQMPNGTSAVTPLAGIGNGVYVGTHAMTEGSGHVSVNVRAAGSTGGMSVVREVGLLATLAEPVLALTDQFFDKVVDVDANGYADQLEIGIGLSATKDVTFSLSGDLVASDGTTVSHALVDVSVAPGPYTATLRFDGSEIARAGKPGPYQVSNVIATKRATGVPILIRWQSVFVTRSAYLPSQFVTQCYALTAMAVGIGSVSVQPPPNCNAGLQYAVGSVVTLTALPTSSSAFLGWSGGVSTTARTVTVTIASDLAMQASFNSFPKVFLPLVRR